MYLGDFLLPETQMLLAAIAETSFNASSLDDWRQLLFNSAPSGGPLSALSFLIQQTASSGFSPVKLKLPSVLLHVTNALLLFMVCYRIERASPVYVVPGSLSMRVAVLTSAAWCLYPGHVSIVMQASYRGSLLAALVVLASLWHYARIREDWLSCAPDARRYSNCLLVMSLLTLLASLFDNSGWLLPLYIGIAEIALFRGQVLADAGRSETRPGLLILACVAIGFGIGFGIAALRSTLPTDALLYLVVALPLLLLMLTLVSLPGRSVAPMRLVMALATVLPLCFAVQTLSRASYWADPIALAQQEYLQTPGSENARLRLANAYQRAAAEQASDAKAQRYVLSAVRIYEEVLAGNGASVEAAAKVSVLHALLGRDDDSHYARLSSALNEAASLSPGALQSLTALSMCVEREQCALTSRELESLLVAAGGGRDNPRFWELLFQNCMAREDMACVRSYAEEALAVTPTFLPAYKALYKAARHDGDIEAAQNVVLRMAEADAARRWQHLIADYAAGRL